MKNQSYYLILISRSIVTDNDRLIEFQRTKLNNFFNFILIKNIINAKYRDLLRKKTCF